MRCSVGRSGMARARSYRAIAGCDVPTRWASCAWVRPARRRASRISAQTGQRVAVVGMGVLYLQGYNCLSTVTRGSHTERTGAGDQREAQERETGRVIEPSENGRAGAEDGDADRDGKVPRPLR